MQILDKCIHTCMPYMHLANDTFISDIDSVHKM